MMLCGRNIDQVLIATLGDEVRLRHHGDPGGGQLGDGVVGHGRGVLDAVRWVPAGAAQRRQRHDQLRGGDAVQRDRHILGMPVTHPPGELVEIETVVVQDSLARRQKVHALTQVPAPARLGHHRRVRGTEIGRRVGQTGDTVTAQAVAELRQVRLGARQRRRPRDVGAAQPAVGMPGQPEPLQPSRIHRPQHAAAVLHPHRHRRASRVQHPAVEFACAGVVIADRPNPAVGTDGCPREQPAQIVEVPHHLGADMHRRHRRRGRADVQVVVVQPGQHGAARRVVDILAGSRHQPVGDVDDPCSDPDVGGRTVEQHGPLDQHRAASRPATRASTRVVSAPSSDADMMRCGTTLHGVSASRGTPA